LPASEKAGKGAKRFKSASDATTRRVRTVVEFEHEEEGKGPSLLIKISSELVREITWVFAAPRDPSEELWVGFYMARPAKPDIAGDFNVLVEKWDIIEKKRH
ncbi:hypothetical protein DXG03_007195, partial [Asterophora parasitica]